MDWDALHVEHVGRVARAVEHALELASEAGAGFDGVVFHAGSPATYHADDLAVPFRGVPHFARFACGEGPHHLLRVRPGERLRLVRVVQQDFWTEAPPPTDDLPDAFDVSEVSTPEEAARALGEGDARGCAYVGNDAAVAARLGIPSDAVEPEALLAPLDWARGTKTPYEVACIRAACERAGRGHAAAREGAMAGASERAIHAAYLEASGQLDGETPYPNIIAWDRAAGVLHYERKRTQAPEPGRVFLIDSGAGARGYASDITRTYARDGVDPAFREALDRMETLQQTLCAGVAPGKSFVELHAQAIAGVAEILCELGLLRVPADEAVERGLANPFLPHGLGHQLGLQVHDVGGQQASPLGGTRPPPDAYRALRNTRTLESGQVVTIEPGLYFIPLLLDPLRAGAAAAAFDWDRIDALLPCGGIRIEDDVHVTDAGADNLSRPFVPGHADA